jgi:hypothetical protein
VPPGARQIQVGKAHPAVRPLSNVHDMAAVARGRDDVERSWRRGFKGVHSIGYKRGGVPGHTGIQQLSQQQPIMPSTSPSGAQKRRQRGRRVNHAALARRVGEDTLIELGIVDQRFVLLRNGYVEIRPGHWRRDHTHNKELPL